MKNDIFQLFLPLKKFQMKHWLIFISLLTAFSGFSQVRKVKTFPMKIKKQHKDIKFSSQSIRYSIRKAKIENTFWYSFNNFGLNMSEVAFSNWEAGGINSISILADAKFRRRFVKEKYFWDNELLVNYGVNIRENEQMQKTDDRLVINSTFGYKASEKSHWYYSAKFSFNSQFANGFKYPNRKERISKFMAPAYIFIGVGGEYAPKGKDLMIFTSPITLKSTFVLDQKLADKGAFGVEPALYDSQKKLIKHGKKISSEVGILVSGHWNTKVYQNMNLTNRFSFYSRYDKNFGNIDVDWEANLQMKINDYVQAKLGFHIKYDDDVKFFEGTLPNGKKYFYGARIQLKQILGIGLSYRF